jgi:hypothetical protein
MGRITGSASIETLVRVGLEKEAGLGPESKMVVLHDFNPCVDDELEVRRGQVTEQRLNERGKALMDILEEVLSSFSVVFYAPRILLFLLVFPL